MSGSTDAALLRAEFDRLEADYADADELPDGVDQRLDEIEMALIAFEERPIIYEPADIGRAGAFVSIDSEGKLRIDRGYVNPEDESPAQPTGTDGYDPAPAEPAVARPPVITVHTNGGSEPQGDADDDDGLKPLSERLVTEQTAHRTVALRDALANDPSVAFTAVLHAFCLATFYRMSSGTCLEIST